MTATTNGEAMRSTAVHERLGHPLQLGSATGEPDFFHSTPLLALLGSDPIGKAKQPFADKIVLVVLHFLANLLPFLKAAIEHGLNPASTILFYKNYDYPSKAFLIRRLQELGFDVRPTSSIGPELFAELTVKTTETGLPILVVEDGGYLTPTLLRDPQLSSRVIGSVEQTTRGIWLIEEAIDDAERTTPFPIISLPHSTLKRNFEPPHIADGAVTAVQNLLYRQSLRNMKAAVLGCGTIGKELVRALAERGTTVTFFDPDPQARVLGLNLCGTVADSAEAAVIDADLVFGACGRQTSITPSVIRATEHGAWLISVSSERIEIDVDYLIRTRSLEEEIKLHPAFVSDATNPTIGTRYYLRPKDKVVNLLAEGKPINFMGFGGMPDQAADLVMSLIFLAATELASGCYTNRKRVLKKAIDNLVVKHNICEQYLQFWA